MPGSGPLYDTPMIARDNNAQGAIVIKEALSQDSSYKSYEVYHSDTESSLGNYDV
ncbi:hypothetical protein GCM10007159_40980 [Modicisalibacter luteus]|nr:hypothetical protein GCM10007159_40980 [Halomonas lutea]